MTRATFTSSSATDGAPGYRERSGQTVEIVEEIDQETDPDKEEADVAPLYRIRFEDGVETEAFDDELQR